MPNEDKTELDIAEQITKAISDTSEPVQKSWAEFNPNEDIPIGKVPKHLRHLHNLFNDLKQETRNSKNQHIEMKRCRRAVHTILFESIKYHTAHTFVLGQSIKICSEWRIVVYNLDEFIQSMRERQQNKNIN